MNGQDEHVRTHMQEHTHRNHLLLFQHHEYASAENNMAQDRRGTSAEDSYGNFV
jgi:hypothetical protein